MDDEVVIDDTQFEKEPCQVNNLVHSLFGYTGWRQELHEMLAKALSCRWMDSPRQHSEREREREREDEQKTRGTTRRGDRGRRVRSEPNR